MRAEDFTDDAPGSVAWVGPKGAKYLSFIPHPLPPTLEWDNPLVLLLTRATDAVGTLAGLGRQLKNPHLLIKPFMQREAVLSSQIEGTQANYRDLVMFAASPPTSTDSTPLQADIREVLNYVHAVEHGLKRLESLPVAKRLIRETHAILMEGVRGDDKRPGEFRERQNWIGPPNCSLAEATFVPPPPDQLEGVLDELDRYMNEGSDLPPLLRLALIHYQFETAHPFLDGNGRIGRLLMVLLLCSWETLPTPLLYLSAYFHQHRDSYYSALQGVRTHGRWRAWIDLFLNGVVEQAQDACRRVTLLSDLRESYYERLHADAATRSATPLRLVDQLFETPAVNANRVCEALGLTHRAAMQNIRKLVHAKILVEVTKRKKNRVYVAEELFRTIQD